MTDHSEAARRKLAGVMVRNLPRFGAWAHAIRDFQTPFGKVGFRQLAILWDLRHTYSNLDDVTPSVLVARMELQPSVITRALAKLEAHQFITRTVDPEDGRRFYIAITEKGTQVSEYVEELFIQELLAGVAFLDDEGITELSRNIDILNDVATRLEDNRRKKPA